MGNRRLVRRLAQIFELGAMAKRSAAMSWLDMAALRLAMAPIINA